MRSEELPIPLLRGRDRFERWRRVRTARRIPDELWQLASRLALAHGVQSTADALRLNAQALRARMATPPATSVAAHDRGFVELPALSLGRAWMVEVTSVGGTRLRIESHGDELDVESLVRRFLESR